MSLPPGSRLGPYEILSPLGAGGMGEVLRARDTRLGREVAIKVLPADFSADPERLLRFEREARATSSLNHPNILTIHDIGTEGGAPYIVSELLEGETLRQILAGGVLPALKAADYAGQMVEGLAAAHEKGIVHRDLKPENVFVTRDGRVKILDFGLAKLTHPTTAVAPAKEMATQTLATEPGVVMGTLGYMAPEQVRGLEADHRSDLFAFGGILYEMLTGRRAFSRSTPADTISAILKEEPTEISRVPGEVPAGLQQVVRRCLEKKPEARFQSARDLALALKDGAAQAPPLPPTSIGRRAAVWASVGLVALVLLAAALVRFLSTGSDRSPPPGPKGTGDIGRIASVAVLPLRDQSGPEAQAYLADGITEALTAELAGIRSLKVISYASASQYKETKKPLREVAQELGVEAIVEGSVTRIGDQVRVTAQLIHAESDTHLWAKNFQRELGGLLALQDEIAREVARRIDAHLSTDEEKRLGASAPIDTKAYEAYLMGRFFLAEGTDDSLKKALEQFTRALDIEKDYAAAHAGVAQYYAILPFYSALSPAEVFPKARAAAERSLALDEGSPEAHASLAYIRAYYEWDWAAAEREFRRALELSPNYADAHFSYSRFLAAAGRLDEATSEIARARDLDPLSNPLKANAALLLYFQNKYDDALKELLEISKTDPGLPLAHWGIGLCHEQKGSGEEAIAALTKAASLSASLNIKTSLGHAYGIFGKGAEARKVLGSLRARAREGYVPSYYFALVHAGLGEKELALDWLERAYQERSTILAYVRLDPRLKPIRAHPRFVRLLQRLGLPDPEARMGSPS